MRSARTIAVVTGSRAEFGLLRTIMSAIAEHPDLGLRTIVTGTHLLAPDRTIEEVAGAFPVEAIVPMHDVDDRTRLGDAAATGRGLLGLADALRRLAPDVVLVLGDRIEAFAAAAAGSIGGVRVAHVHGGDRAEGVADEAMRHAITKLAHIHLPATAASARRIIAMGEPEDRVHVVGSPALDGLGAIPALDDGAYDALGRPEVVVLLHPCGRDDAIEHDVAARVLRAATARGRVLALHPNHDPGRSGIVAAITEWSGPSATHLARPRFIGLLRRASVLVGNSSAGLIEAAAVPVRVVNVGPRQAGRERPEHVVDVPDEDEAGLARAIDAAVGSPRLGSVGHPYGDGASGRRVASVLATFDPRVHDVRKHNAY
ncbi:MAG: UDP-N-acetylglucosamine 2-epimerase (hydrolyzing) [Phycisphaerales bacterium]|nr:UDP-N-acetylglucosamine 2-epimerase (hydrolyzing) [Phycisphaerales bacterium]